MRGWTPICMLTSVSKRSQADEYEIQRRKSYHDTKANVNRKHPLGSETLVTC
jgi:hypothetical protein